MGRRGLAWTCGSQHERSPGELKMRAFGAFTLTRGGTWHPASKLRETLFDDGQTE